MEITHKSRFSTDLKQELKVVERHPHSKKEDGSENDNALINGHVSTHTQVEIETQTSMTTPQKRELLLLNCLIIIALLHYMSFHSNIRCWAELLLYECEQGIVNSNN